MRKFIAVVLAFLSLGLPAVLTAKARRGANVVITLLDGRQVKGELIAVRNDSLVLLSPGGPGKEGAVDSIDIKNIHGVRVLRKSRAGTGLLLGAALGALAGGIAGLVEAPHAVDAQLTITTGVLVFGAAGALVGFAIGAVAELDKTMVLAGRPEPLVRNDLAKLARMSRERSVLAPRPGRTGADRPSVREAVPGATARLESIHEPQFKLTWSGTLDLRESGPYLMSADGSFRFIGDYPEPTGPFPVEYYMSGERPQSSLGCVDLAYAWDRHWSAEIEVQALPGRDLFSYGEMEFTSALDVHPRRPGLSAGPSRVPPSSQSGLRIGDSGRCRLHADHRKRCFVRPVADDRQCRFDHQGPGRL